jgi:hypothetical protein
MLKNADVSESVAEKLLAFAERDTDVNTPLPALRYPGQWSTLSLFCALPGTGRL